MDILFFIWALLILLALAQIEHRTSKLRRSNEQIFNALEDLNDKLEKIGRSLDPDGSKYHASIQHDLDVEQAKIQHDLDVEKAQRDRMESQAAAKKQHEVEEAAANALRKETRRREKEEKKGYQHLKGESAVVKCPACGASPEIKDLRPTTEHTCPSCKATFRSEQVVEYE